jgi:hypothetical protein
MADPSVALGVAGICGTLLGVLAGNATTLVVERRKERRDEARQQGDLRTAARLVASEVGESRAAVATALATRRPLSAQIVLSSTAWVKHQELLASMLTQDEYNSVSSAYIQLKLDASVISAAGDAELSDFVLASLADTVDVLERAQLALRRPTAD